MAMLDFAIATYALAASLSAPTHGPNFFNFSVDWSGGSHGNVASRTLPTENAFSIRKLESFHYAADGRTYGYADIVNYTDPHYPISYSSEVGVFSSTDGKQV